MFTKTGAEKRSDKLHKRGGTTAVATVLEYDQGMTYGAGAGSDDAGSLGRVEHYTLKVRVEPDGEPPFEASVKATSSDDVIVKFKGAIDIVPREGDEVPVIYDPKDHSKVALDLTPPETFLSQFRKQPAAAVDLEPQDSRFAALIKQHGVHLGQQTPDVRAAIEADLRAAGVPLHPGGLIKFTDRAQIESAVEVFKKHGLMPKDATLG